MLFCDPQDAVSIVRSHLSWRQYRSLDLCSFLSEIFSYCWESRKCFNQLFGLVFSLKTTIYFFVFLKFYQKFQTFFFISIVFPYGSTSYLIKVSGMQTAMSFQCMTLSLTLTNYLEMLIRLHRGRDLQGLCRFVLWLPVIFQGQQTWDSAKRSYPIVFNLAQDRMLTSCH